MSTDHPIPPQGAAMVRCRLCDSVLGEQLQGECWDVTTCRKNTLNRIDADRVEIARLRAQLAQQVGPHSATQGTVAALAEVANEIRAVRTAITPVIDWYQSDEVPLRPLAEIVGDIVTDLQNDRRETLTLRTALHAAQQERDTTRGQVAALQHSPFCPASPCNTVCMCGVHKRD